MAPSTLWNRFRKFRLIVLALASILSLVWSIITAVYMANNWSSYNSSQRGFLFGLIALDFVGSVLLYLMVVVQYQFWPDAARTTVLFGLHVAGAVVFMVLSPKFPCSAFGSTANCQMMTIIVFVGSWVIAALMLMYTICLPIMAFIPRPTPADDLENPPDIAEVEEDMRKSHVSSASRTWLFSNQDSPQVHMSNLPIPSGMPAARTASNASSFSSLKLSQAVDDRIELEVQSAASVYSDPSAKTIRVSDNADRSLNSSGISSSGQYPYRSNSIQSPSLPNRFVGEALDANRVSVSSSAYGSTYEYPMVSEPLAEAPHRTPSTTTESSASVYSQNTVRANTLQGSTLTSPSMPNSPVHSMMGSVHGHAEIQSAGADYDTPSSGFLSPPLTALPTPRFSTAPRQATFEFYRSEFPSRESNDKVSDLPRDTVYDPVQHPIPVLPGLQHVRTDSTTSIVDLDEWRRLVLSAAGQGQ